MRKEILKNDAFDRLRSELGGAAPFDALAARRIATINGDVTRDGLGLSADDRAQFASCDVIIHSAAAVAFDSPLDSAVEINLLGPSRIVQLCQELGITPHMVAVSTCYVAGNRRGSAPEELVSAGPFDMGLDWRQEVASARRLRSDIEAISRVPERLRSFRSEARHELGAAGSPALAAKTEQRRERWVHDQLVEHGRARAASVGWPDAYAYTKALGEQALHENKGDVPVSIVRPSIIESAHAEPFPGWIRGFRMAEPVILSYARGLLKEFPGVPEGTVDVIPSITSWRPSSPSPVRVRNGPPRSPRSRRARSTRSSTRRWSTTSAAWFTAHPFYDAKGQPIVVPDWSFPGRGRVQGQLNRAKRVITKSEQLLQALPLRGAQAAWSAKLEEKRNEVDRALEYVELYGLYTECEAIYSIDNLLALWDGLDDHDRQMFWFDPRVIDWPKFVQETHLPSIVHHGRVKTTPGRSRGDSRSTRTRRQVLSPDRHVAAFDLENTLIASNVVASYSWLATRRLNNADKTRYVLRTLKEAPSLLALDRKDRSDFLRFYYRRYQDAPVEQIAEDSQELFSALILTKSFPAAIRRVREHREQGHRTVLITGALDFVVEPLRPLFDEIIAAKMSVRADGRYSGQMTDVPPTGETRAQLLSDYCTAEGLKMSESVAYADSTSDLPMLEAVGFAVAVNPETRLAAIARKRGWLVEHWSKAAGSPQPLLPVAATRADARPGHRGFR